MSFPNRTYTHSRLINVLHLLTALMVVLTLSAITFAQAAPTLTLNSNVGLFNFGRFNTGAISPDTVITISNGGTIGSVTITNVTITGANAGDFTLSATTCIGQTLTTVGTCTASVRFNPLVIGVRTANLTVTDNANGSQHLVPLTGTGLNPSIPNKAVGPVDPRVAFPLWYQDELGVRLTLCLDNSGFCVLAPDFNTAMPVSVTTASVNFPSEGFYWYADSRITRASGGLVRLTIAKEGAFTTAGATVGKQITFERIRVRIDQLTAGATYTITHPFGVMTAVADASGGIVINSSLVVAPLAAPAPAPAPVATTDATTAKGSGGGGGSTAEINTTEDIGCGASPCDFRVSLDGKISRFLKWDPAVAPLAPAGYLGNPTVTHAITGSPFNTNIFKIDGPNVGGSGINTIQTNQFTLAGKLFQ